MHPREAAQHRARGASELPAAVDCEFRVEPYEEEGVLVGTLFTNAKSKDTALTEPVIFDMINVGLGVCDGSYWLCTWLTIDTLVHWRIMLRSDERRRRRNHQSDHGCR